MASERYRIAVYSPSLVSGGAERTAVNLFNGFSERGFPTHLLLADPSGPLLSDVRYPENLIGLGHSGVLASLPRFASYLKTHSPAILLSAQTHANIIAVWARMLSRAGTRLVLSEHSTLTVNYSMETGLKNRAIPPLVHVFLPRAEALVCVSRGVADDVIRARIVPPGRVHVIYNPVLTPEFEKQTRLEPSHTWLAEASTPVALAVGRLTAAKDYPTLLRAFALLRAQRELRLLILGEGEKRAELEALVVELGLVDDVSMPGFDPVPAAAMSRAAMLVLSSAWEGFANVIVEALACGTPVVATDCPSGPSEILAGGRYGRLVPVGDAAALARSMLETLDSEPERDRLRRRAQDFTLEAALDRYLGLFDTLLGHE